MSVSRESRMAAGMGNRLGIPDTVLRTFPHDIQPVAELDSSDQTSLRQSVLAHQPFVCNGLISSWPLFERVAKTPVGHKRIELFEDLLGDANVRYTFTPAEQRGDIGIGTDLNPNFRMDDRVTSAHDFLTIVSDLVHRPTGECAYAGALPLADFPETSSQLSSLDAIGGDELQELNLWIGSGDHVVDLHFDGMRNLISMIEGVKRVTIFPPEALPFIYPAPLHRRVAGVTRSLVKLLNVDWKKYPRFRTALKMAKVALIKPGDTLHIPALWWHHVESYGFNAMVNAWYADTPEPARKEYRKANILFRESIASFSRLDDATVKQFACWFDSIVFGDRPIDEMRSDAAFARYSRRRQRRVQQYVDAVRNSQADLPEYWRQNLRTLYDYYVLRKYGDAYPTLPGMLQEVARAVQPGLWDRFRSRAAKLFGRAPTDASQASDHRY